MSDITISRPAQGVVLLGLLGAIAALVAAQIPEARRYLRIRSM
jgi:hypothetical protein